MATDARGHIAPAPGETPRRQVINDLSLSINDVVVVANATARAAKVVELANAGVPVSTTRPLLVWRSDAAAGAELEVSTNGTDFTTYYAGSGTAGTTSIGVLAGTFDPLKPVWTLGWAATATTNASGDTTVALPAGIAATCLLDANAHGRGAAAFPITAHIFTNLSTSLTNVSMRLYNGASPAVSTSVTLGVDIWYQR